jgi:hypothetical protein
MPKTTPAQRKIARLRREIERIDELFYGGGSDDSEIAFQLERKRDAVVRSAVIQTHLEIEDLLTDWLTPRILGTRSKKQGRRLRSKSARALHNVLRDLGFEKKLNLAVVARLITSKTFERLAELNRLRNRCSHNWLLKVVVRRGKKPKEKKPPLLLYRGRDLHKVAVFDQFASEYGRLYVKLFLKSLD